MKKFSFVYLLFASLLIQSCNKIDDPYIPLAPKDWYGKRVLLEDYTGHTCLNCPAAANIAANIKTLYGDKIVIISVHAGYFARPETDFPEDFTTTASEIWYKFFGVNGNPKGMINRKGVLNKTNILNPGDWASMTGTVMTEIPEVDLEIMPEYDTTTKILKGSVKTKFLKTIRKKLKLQILVTEDSIIAPQKNGTTTIANYVHRHVMRGTVNGSWGDVLSNGQNNSIIDTEISQNMLFTFDPSWKSKHCTIVAFVYDSDTYEVLQVAEKHIE
ncbi:MAG: Omp28 family outer membrane lipoprotein [Bacteroidales bacterium]|jgi:hypothetical protein